MTKHKQKYKELLKTPYAYFLAYLDKANKDGTKD